MTKRLLLLGGSGEARSLAQALARYPEIETVTSLAGRTRDPAALPGKVISGGFGGPEGLADYLNTQNVALMIDATHPFAARMSANAARAAALSACPCLHLRRPAWQPQPGDRWLEVADLPAAAARLGELDPTARACVFLATGHRGLEAFAALQESFFLIRLIEAPAVSPPLCRFEILRRRGPFSLADELALFQERSVSAIVAKNSGGAGSYPKIAAARALGLPVLMIARPTAADGPSVSDADAALNWVLERLDIRPKA